MFNPICPYCGAKLHRHEIKEWEINKKTSVYKQRHINLISPIIINCLNEEINRVQLICKLIFSLLFRTS